MHNVVWLQWASNLNVNDFQVFKVWKKKLHSRKLKVEIFHPYLTCKKSLFVISAAPYMFLAEGFQLLLIGAFWRGRTKYSL